MAKQSKPRTQPSTKPSVPRQDINKGRTTPKPSVRPKPSK